MAFGPVSPYLRELARRLGELVGESLVGVYAGGSYALGAYEERRSDLDVAAIIRSGAGRRLKAAIVAAIRHPARRGGSSSSSTGWMRSAPRLVVEARGG